MQPVEPYHIQKERMRQGLEDAHRPFNFYCSDIYKSLSDELEEAYKANDVELCIGIISDIETAKKNFNSKLPWWIKLRWDSSDLGIYKDAKKEYERNIYKRETIIYVDF